MESKQTTIIHAASMWRGTVERFSVECEISSGIGIHVIGIPDAAVRESLLRIVTALQAVGYTIPGKKIIVNIRPESETIPNQSVRRASSIDLAIALAMLAESGKINALPLMNEEKPVLFVGELALDGAIRCPETGLDTDRDAAAIYDWQLKEYFYTVAGFETSLPLRDFNVWKGFRTLPEVIDAINADIL